MKKYTVDPKTAAYSESIEITETTDTNHADNINAAPKQLMANTAENTGASSLSKPVRYRPHSTKRMAA